MGTSKKVRFAAAMVAAGAMTFASSCALGSDSGAETVVIGVDLDLAGEGAALGEVFRTAIELRVEQVNQQGLLGDRELELVVKDNRSDRSTAVANLGELAADSSVTAIISGACDECVVDAAEALNGAGVPTISLGKSDQVTEPIEERRYIFKLGPNATDNAAALVRELVAADASTVGVVTSTDQYGEDALGAMEVQAQRAGIEVAVTQRLGTTADEATVAEVASELAAYQSEEIDSNLLVQVDEPAGLDAVVVWAPWRVASQLAQSLDALGYEGELVFDASAAEAPFLTGSTSEALDGARMIFTEIFVIDEVIATSPAKAARQTWYRDFTTRDGTYQAVSSFAADAVQLVVDAVNRADSTDRDTVRNAIEGARMDGFSGPIAMGPQNHSGLMAQALTPLVVRGDRWRLSG